MGLSGHLISFRSLWNNYCVVIVEVNIPHKTCLSSTKFQRLCHFLSWDAVSHGVDFLQVTDEEKLQIAQHYLLSSPPGQFQEVLTGTNLSYSSCISFISFLLCFRCSQIGFQWTSFGGPSQRHCQSIQFKEFENCSFTFRKKGTGYWLSMVLVLLWVNHPFPGCSLFSCGGGSNSLCWSHRQLSVQS